MGEEYRGFIIMPEYDGEISGEISGYAVMVDDESVSEIVGEEVGSMMGGFASEQDAMDFIDSELPNWVPQHTPEPWVADIDGVFDYGDHGVYAHNFDRLVALTITTGDEDEQSPANAERIVACVNGCAGIVDPSGVNALRSALGQMVRVFNVNEIDPLAAFVTIEYARAALDRVEGR